LRTAARLSIVQHQARLSGVDHADQGALGRTGRVARHGTAGTVSPLGRPPPRLAVWEEQRRRAVR